MGWSIGYDETWKRDIGYGVPAFCDHPGCDKEIDRGLSFVCGRDPYGGDHGCGLYFCDEHHLGSKEIEGEDEAYGLCERCENDEPPFDPKPEHPRWIRHVLTDASWATWRAEEPQGVKRLRAMLPAPGAPQEDHATTREG